MDVTKIAAGRAVPADINVVIEIPANSDPVKYELDKDSGAILVDRFMATPMFYPANYGFIPNTLSDDGDPVDVMVVTPYPIVPGSVIRARPIGVLKMEDESGMDEKILAVPHSKITVLYDNVQTYTDLPELLVRQIEHFFTRYKDLEKGKWVKIAGWGDVDTAKQLIEEGVARAGK
ncbi:inorganic pyrophosphatase [Tistrella bauzanensis]|uniref:Inorganic pyrophosphatase n=1 Tax=Tistrella bauzanensis TaxID=657419 RepID=A0ABQ1J787_9PROT|nr:inorganic diphosphatase [Tistrella bauzanensis]GGB59693.1 inorganic pyrophosphatase [Tistrella bauzanensis]